MRDMNLVILHGRIGADPEIRTNGNGGMVARLRVATNIPRRQNDNSWKDFTTWHTVKVFGRLAEELNGTLSKGCRVVIHGSINTSQFTQRDGSTAYATEVIADSVIPAAVAQRRQAPPASQDDPFGQDAPASRAPPAQQRQSAPQEPARQPTPPSRGNQSEQSYAPAPVSAGEEDPFGHYGSL